MIDHEGLIKEARKYAWAMNKLGSDGTGALLTRLADALEARVLSPSEGDLCSVGSKPILPVVSLAVCEPAVRWIKNDGKLRSPIAELFEVKLRNGELRSGGSVSTWLHNAVHNAAYDVVAYRLLTIPGDGSQTPSASVEEAISEGDVATEHNTPPNIPTAETGGEG